jgi:hypothetical protein
MKCVHCGEPIYYEARDASFFHRPPYAWGSDEWTRPSSLHAPGTTFIEPNPEWQNGYYCTEERTTSALPPEENEGKTPPQSRCSVLVDI